MNESVIRANLALMTSSKEGGMRWMSLEESMGGNAGTYRENGKKYPCLAFNFVYGVNGQILAFGNPQDEHYLRAAMKHAITHEGTFRVAMDVSGKSGLFRIVGYALAVPDENIVEAVRRYNAMNA